MRRRLSEVVVTIKGGAGYDAPWIVFKGDSTSQVFDHMVEAADMDPESVSDVHLLSLTMEVAALFKAVESVGTELGGRASGSSKWEAARSDTSAPATSSTPPANKPDPTAELLGAVQKCNSIPELQDLWSRNQSAFAADELMAAYRARGKELQS